MVQFGSDFLLQDGDLQVSGRGDLSTTSEKANIEQAVRNVLCTELGDLDYDYEYGVNVASFMGTKNTGLKRLILGTAIKQALLKDSRITDIPYLSVVPDIEKSSKTDVSFEMTTVNTQQPEPFNFVFPFVPFQVETTQVVETLTSSDNNLVKTSYVVYKVNGVYLPTDTELTVNYFEGGHVNGNEITLGTRLPLEHTSIVVDYLTTDTTKSYSFVQTSQWIIPFGNIFYEILDYRTIFVSQVNTASQRSGLQIDLRGFLEKNPQAESIKLCFSELNNVLFENFIIGLIDIDGVPVSLPLSFSDEDLENFGVLIDRERNCIEINLLARTVWVNNLIRNQNIIINEMVFENV